MGPTEEADHQYMANGEGTGGSGNPSTFFVVLIALVSCQVNMAAAETYWIYVPDPPVVNPATWTGEPVPVFSNNTHMVGGEI
ncbi:hypothetical protein QTO34_000693 [Cnephaeus nilssonii]|uniref:Uncharacterized protein n=1 Tax=Cnephaeus nilssonii TaxID=3371016 RepID=A0AA40IC22_CNENI|nr:hypothetical protein QTO34_000693 [Eptesicus nilssonii]